MNKCSHLTVICYAFRSSRHLLYFFVKIFYQATWIILVYEKICYILVRLNYGTFCNNKLYLLFYCRKYNCFIMEHIWTNYILKINIGFKFLIEHYFLSNNVVIYFTISSDIVVWIINMGFVVNTMHILWPLIFNIAI